VIDVAWVTPKTDWHGGTTNGVYSGDYFNASDFNRIKNNLEHLREMSVKMYDEYSIGVLGSDRNVGDYFYADEINTLEQNLTTINDHTLKRSYGVAPIFTENGNTVDYTELNRIETASLDLYNTLMNQHDGRRMLTWNFGMKEGL
jgi:hypothetical protein